MLDIFNVNYNISVEITSKLFIIEIMHQIAVGVYERSSS